MPARTGGPASRCRRLWSFALLLTVAIGFIVTTFLSGLAGGAGHLLTGVGATSRGGADLAGAERRRVLARLPARHRPPGALARPAASARLIAAVIWQVLQVAGGYVVSHQLHRANELYGTFGVVLGLVAWLYLQAEATL